MKIGIEVVTGFLGAGKSAFINSLIDKTIVKDERVVVLCCEKGNTIIQKESNNGSIKAINFFEESTELRNRVFNIIDEYKPHRIIIEYNGTESLEYLYKCIFDKELEKVCKLYTMYFICDGTNISFYIKNMGEILLPFIQNSDVILINNCSNLSRSELQENKKNLEELNNRAHILVSKNNNHIGQTLDESNLIENENIRNMRVKIINYMNKWKSR